MDAQSDPQAPQTATFCVTCGGPDPVADGECKPCLLDELDVVRGPKERVYVEICRHCGATPVRDIWREPSSRRELVEENAIGSLAVPEDLEEMGLALTVDRRTDDHYEITAHVDGTYKGVPVQGEAQVEVRVKGASCPACSRRHGGYFEAIVQVRREGEHDVNDQEAGTIAQIIEEEVGRTGGMAGGQSYLLKAVPMHGGYDYYFGTKAVARAVAKRLMDLYGARMNESFSVVGRVDGKEMRRLTLAVRIPQATPGTYVGFKGEVLQIHGRKGNRLLTRRVEDHAKRMLEDRELDRLTILEPRALDVVYAEGGEGQIMDPETYRTHEVRLPKGVEMGDQVQGIKYEGTWVILDAAPR